MSTDTDYSQSMDGQKKTEHYLYGFTSIQTINAMTNQDQQQINRLIQTGTPENLSLAYQLLCSEMDEVEAMVNILKYRCYEAGEQATFFGKVVFRTYNCYNTVECVLYVHSHKLKRSGHYHYIKTFLEEFRHIWQDKI